MDYNDKLKISLITSSRIITKIKKLKEIITRLKKLQCGIVDDNSFDKLQNALETLSNKFELPYDERTKEDYQYLRMNSYFFRLVADYLLKLSQDKYHNMSWMGLEKAIHNF